MDRVRRFFRIASNEPETDDEYEAIEKQVVIEAMNRGHAIIGEIERNEEGKLVIKNMKDAE